MATGTATMVGVADTVVMEATAVMDMAVTAGTVFTARLVGGSQDGVSARCFITADTLAITTPTMEDTEGIARLRIPLVIRLEVVLQVIIIMALRRAGAGVEGGDRCSSKGVHAHAH